MNTNTLKYTLSPNPLTGDSFRAIMTPARAVDIEGIIKQMKILGSTVTEADIRAVVTELLRVVEIQLLGGRSVNLGGIVRLWFGIRGEFADEHDYYDESRHELYLHANAGLAFRKRIQNKIVTQKVETVDRVPKLYRVIDKGSGQESATITPARNAIIKGKRLKFNEDQPDEGVFFINLADRSETRATEITRNDPQELTFLVPPELPAGADFQLVVRTRELGTNGLRSGVLDATLSSEALAA
ncbi:DUF4469 domain-containing protein [Cerasicoccus fimbriatus]|uniref:DUF4469 domain-containing protein n=1 Tax=Cerasicoccus fimbriatus TaxID=3014554 RepID=UPI0022B51B21|nr:DUF4469 domain-containing protein [Cerasicoccus sp. TK19100]